jgi:hypothetical protein
MKVKGKAHSKRFARPSDDRDSWKTMTKRFNLILSTFNPFNLENILCCIFQYPPNGSSLCK